MGAEKSSEPQPRVVIAGASGFIGRALVDAFTGWDVVALSRTSRSQPGARTVYWDGRSIGAWLNDLSGATAVINLAGSPVNVKWNAHNRREILDSRVETAHAFASAIAATPEQPCVWINASAVGFYGDRGDEILDESTHGGEGFLAQVCRAWEAAILGSQRALLRRVVVRIGVVLGRGGGAFPALSKVTRMGLGGPAGNGQQWVSWIHAQDLARMFVWCATEKSVSGPVNGVAPNPVQNRDLMFTMRRVLRRPWSPPTPKLLLMLAGKLGGPNPDLLLHSARVVPKVAEGAGFDWRFPSLEAALRDLVPGQR